MKYEELIHKIERLTELRSEIMKINIKFNDELTPEDDSFASPMQTSFSNFLWGLDQQVRVLIGIKNKNRDKS